MMRGNIIITNAKTNNLKNVSLKIPRDKFVVITGVSGSGKSSLAFDTIYAEGNRRYMESLSSYARSILDVAVKPDVEKIENLSPAIAIDQKSIAKSPRSTVGTLTEIYDFLRIMYAKIGTPYCEKCALPMTKAETDEIMKKIESQKDGTEIMLLVESPERGRTTYDQIHHAESQGYVRVRIEGKTVFIAEAKRKYTERDMQSVEIVIDRIEINQKEIDRERIVDSIYTAFHIGKGSFIILYNNKTEEVVNENFRCIQCGFTIDKITPRHFSFNSPEGACGYCGGMGTKNEIDPKELVSNKSLSIAEGAIHIWSKSGGKMEGGENGFTAIKDFARRNGIPLTMALAKMPSAKKKILLYGTGEITQEFNGIIPELEKKYNETKSEYMRREIEKYMTIHVCPGCDGKRLQKIYRNVRVVDKTIDDITQAQLSDAKNILMALKTDKRLNKDKQKIASGFINEIVGRLEALEDVGLEYLNLSRSSETLSGGEAQRIRLAVQIKSELMGVTYVLDEPSVGLHGRDIEKLIFTLKKLRDAGNSLIVVEHEKNIMKAADWIVDVGPGAGINGGEILYNGDVKKIISAKTETAQFLTGNKKIEILQKKRRKNTTAIEIIDAEENNLKKITVKIPLGKLVAVVGVSGSGKSSLIHTVLGRFLSQYFHNAKKEPGKHKKINGLKNIDKVINIDQSPIGRTPRSNAATYTGVFMHIRELFAATEEAKKQKLSASYFSFNMRGGRCEACQGDGYKKVEMYLLPDMYIKCESCNGSRYSKKVLSILYNSVSIADVLDMSVEYAHAFFIQDKHISYKLQTLIDVGLGYLKLGQNATSLSGGEAQRIKLGSELARKQTGKTLYILDEPTTGLHFQDVQRLLNVLNTLVEKGNSVLVVEHNTDIITNADWVIELGPDGGHKGGHIVFEGTVAELKKKKTWTAQYL